MDILPTRRLFLTGIAIAIAIGPAQIAWAKDGSDDDGGSDDSDSEHSGSDDHSGDGDSENGDSGSGDSDGGSDSSGHDNNGSSHNGSGEDHSRIDQDEALRAVKGGEIMSLKEALGKVGDKYKGKVIEIDIERTVKRDVYSMKVRMEDGTIRKVRMDARTGKFAGLFGF
jgi:uncharacterized membrane protein YkoI